MSTPEPSRDELLAELDGLRNQLERLQRGWFDETLTQVLRVERAYLDQLFDSAPEAIVVLDTGSRILRANRHFTKLFGYTLPEVVGKSIDDLLAPEHTHAEAVTLTEQIAQGRQIAVETVRRRKDGSVVDVSILGTPIRVDGGQVAVYGIYRDITPRRQAERAREASLALFQGLVDNMQAGILVETADRKIFAVNAALLDAFGIPAPSDRLAGTDCAAAAERVKPLLADPDRFSRRIAEIIEGGAPITAEEIRFADGGIFERDYVPIRAADGAFVGHMWQYRDVSERRRLEAQLRQAQKMEAIGQLTGGIAHDFNNLLTVIRSNAELLTKPEGSEPVRSDELEDILQAVTQGSALVKKMLAFGRQQDLALHPLDLARLVSDLAGTLRRILPEDIEVAVHTDPHTGVVRADPTAIEQIILNLVTNARDAMPDGGTVTLAVDPARVDELRVGPHDRIEPGDYACLAVTDTGTGIAPRDLERLFEPFFTTKPPGKGSGMGMSMVYGLVKQHRGAIDVLTEPGRGTTMRIYLPDAGDAEPDRAGETDAALPTGTETILVIEDEAAIRSATQRLLERQGFTVLTAADGREGLAVLRERPDVDLVMTDVVMPEMGGREFHERLLQQGPAVKVLLCSGYQARGEPPSGPDRHLPFLAKPWTVTDLLVKLREVLDAD